MSLMLEAKNLVKHFGPVIAVDDLSLQLKKGEVLGLLGPNGAGKTTTMKLLTGFLVPTSGHAGICGHDIAEEPIPAKRKFGYLPEGAPAYGEMTALGFLEFVASARGMTGDAAKGAVETAVAAVHLAGVLNQPIDTLSKGFRRRVGLAQAILHDPEVLILDEPTDGLDPNQKHEARELISRMAPEKAIIISTHQLEEVEAVCSRAVIIDHGRIVADGTPDELRARSRYHNAVTVTFSGDAPEGCDVKIGALKAVAEVRQLASMRNRARLRIFPRDGAAILDEVATLSDKSGWAIDEISVDEGRLDDVFRSVTTGDAAELGNAAA